MKMIYDSYLRRNRNSSNGKNNNNNGSINGEICHPSDFNANKTGVDEMDSLDGYIILAESLVINKELGVGEFGIVQQGVWTNKEGRRIQVAIKCLSAARLENSQSEFMKEATIMHRISHEHIVTLYGVVLEPSIQLVTELAPLRSLLECLKEPTLIPHFPVTSLCLFTTQIADGMAYLESKRLIHRDLAARNILVFTKDKVKISDFGLSRALGVGKDYYQSNFNVNLKLPIAWCAPECINYLKFTSQSDVWAYGVTLWEMFSFGFQPWAALTGQQILEAIDQPNYQRLEQPECCPKEYYQLMLKCWTDEPHLRPKFSEIVNLLPDCKPELLQAIRNSDIKKDSTKNYLIYKIGDIVTVIDKFCIEAPDSCWKGVTAERKTGYFNPGDFVAYLGQNLPSSTNSSCNSFMQHFLSGNASTNGSASSNGNNHNSLASTITSTVLQSSKFLRGFLDPKGNNQHSNSSPHANRKNRLRPEISKPQGDFKHTGHVGADGVFFGDVSFLEGKYQHLSKYSSNDAIDAKSKISISNPISSYNRNQATTEKCDKLMSNSLMQENHEYHEISDEDELGPQESSSFEVLDFGPSLMEEVFRELDHIKPDLNNDAAESETMINESGINVKNEVRELNLKMSKEVNNCKKKQSMVKPISEAEQNELDSAIAMAKDIANRTMLEDDLDLTKNDSPKTPNSPNKRKFSFKFPTHKSSPKGERRTFSEETESIGNIIESITPAAKEAYLSLVDKGVSSGPIATAPLSREILETSLSSPTAVFTGDSVSLGSNHTSTEQTALSPTELDNNPLRMLRIAGIGKVLRPKVRGNRSFSQPRLPTTAQTAGLARVASSRSQLGSPPPVPSNGEPGALCPAFVTSNALPLPPRDRSRPLIHLKTHQRRHPLVIPVELAAMTEPLDGSSKKSGDELGNTAIYKHDSSQVLQRHVPVLKQVSCPQAPAAFLSGYNKSINANTNHVNNLLTNNNGEKVPASSNNTNRAYLWDDLTESLESEIQKALDNIKIGQSINNTGDHSNTTNDSSSHNGMNNSIDPISTGVSDTSAAIRTSARSSKPSPIVVNTQVVESQPKTNNEQESRSVVKTSQTFQLVPQSAIISANTPVQQQISEVIDVVKPSQTIATSTGIPKTTIKSNPKRTIDSDEVRVMQKVLVNEINLTSQECTNILDSTDWDIHKAIKCVRLRQQLRNHNINVDCNWAQMLAKFNWNIRQASNYLIATQGVPEDTTEV